MDLILFADYLSPAVLWVVAGLVLLLVELNFPGLFFFVSFAFGCLFGAFGAWLGYSLATQFIIVLIVSLIQFNAMRRLLRRYTESVQIPTNMQALLGKRAVVIEPISAHKTGAVKIAGELWAASAPYECPEGSVVKVLRVEGNRVVVTLDHTEKPA